MQPNVEAVLGVHPDLVVIYASPSNRAAAMQLRTAGVNTLAIRDDHISDLRRTRRDCSRAPPATRRRAATIADSVERSLAAVRDRPRPAKPPTVFWHMWDSPILTIGGGSFLDELVTIAGAKNIFGDLAAPSPQVTLEEIVRRNPDFVLVGPAEREGAARERALAGGARGARGPRAGRGHAAHRAGPAYASARRRAACAR